MKTFELRKRITGGESVFVFNGVAESVFNAIVNDSARSNPCINLVYDVEGDYLDYDGDIAYIKKPYEELIKEDINNILSELHCDYFVN